MQRARAMAMVVMVLALLVPGAAFAIDLPEPPADAELVAAGLADVRAYEPDTRHHDWFLELQSGARETGRGMYGGEPEETEEPGLLEQFLDLIDWDRALGG